MVLPAALPPAAASLCALHAGTDPTKPAGGNEGDGAVRAPSASSSSSSSSSSPVMTMPPPAFAYDAYTDGGDGGGDGMRVAKVGDAGGEAGKDGGGDDGIVVLAPPVVGGTREDAEPLSAKAGGACASTERPPRAPWVLES